jgi:proliferating cell nuclear antigen PCNA
MLIKISDKIKKDLFISIFQILKGCSSSVTLYLKPDHLYIQGMDKAHVCLFEIKLDANWFNLYSDVVSDTEICVSTHFFYNILSTCEDKHTIELCYDSVEDNDSIYINLTSGDDVKGSYNKYFKLPLCDIDSTLLLVGEIEYNAEFSVLAKKIYDIVSQLAIFGDIMNIKCSESEEHIDIISSGEGGEMRVAIPIEDLSEYSICEDEVINISYSLNYLQKMCITTKLTDDISFYISQEQPLKIRYDLGGGSFFHFFIAPKMAD